MKFYEIKKLEMYTNKGQNKEASLAYALCGEIRKHGNLPFNQGSDIPEFHMSVKSAKASLCQGRFYKTEEKATMLDEFFNAVASNIFAFVTDDYKVYEMSKTEFRAFVEIFSGISRESAKNGGYRKIQIYAESKKMLEWLDSHSNR